MPALALEAVRLDQRAVLGRASLHPVAEARLVDEMDRPRGLAAVGDEQS